MLITSKRENRSDTLTESDLMLKLVDQSDLHTMTSNRRKKRKLSEESCLKRPLWNLVTSGFRGASGRVC